MLGTVTVTATRTPVPLVGSLAPTFVISSREIEDSGATTVAGVLRRYAGLTVAQLGGPGQPVSVFMRGANSNYTVVLVDGVRINDASSGLAPLADIGTQMIERIEVVEGPRTVLYGADAIGGVINIITRRSGPRRLDVAVGGGSHDTISGAAALRDEGDFNGGRWGAALSVQQQHSGGFPVFAGSDQAAAYRNRTLAGRFTASLGAVELEARAWDAHGSTQYEDLAFDGPGFSFSGFVPASDDFHDQVLALEARTHLTTRWTSSVTAARSADVTDQNQPDASDLPPGFVRTVRPELDWHNVVSAGEHHRVSFGARAQNERVSSLSFGDRIGESTTQAYGYLQDELDYGRHHAVAAVNYLHDGAFGGRFDWSAEYGYDLFAHTRLIANAGSAFHTPTANDRFGFGGNPELRPEKALDYELAVRQQLTPAQDLELRLFRSDVRDLIELRYDQSVNAFSAFNVDKARMDGVQLRWNYAAQAWRARASMVYQDPRDLTTGQRLLRRPRWAGSGHLDRRLGRFDLGGDVYAAGDRADVDGITGATGVVDGGYVLFGLRAGVRLDARTRLQLHLGNLLDHRYQTVNGYNQAGRTVYMTLRYTLPG